MMRRRNGKTHLRTSKRKRVSCHSLCSSRSSFPSPARIKQKTIRKSEKPTKPKTLPDTVLEAQTRSIHLGAGNGASRRRWAFSTKLLVSLALVVLFHCSMYCLFARVNWMVGGRRTRQTLRRRRGLFVVLLPVVLSFRLIFTPAMSREDSLATAILRSSDSKADVSPSVRRQTSHSVHYVQAVQLLSKRRYQTTNSNPWSQARLESHKPPRVAPILQTGVRSRSFTNGGSLPLRRSSTGDLFHGADERPKSFVIRPMLTALIKVISFYIWAWPICSFEPVSSTIYLQGSRSIEENLIRHVMSFGDWVSYAENSGGFTGFPPPCSTSLDFSCWKKLPEGLPGSVLIRSYSSFEEKLLPPYLLSIERGVSLVSLLSVCFSFLIVLLSCVAVSTGPEDAIEITSVFLVDEIWTLTSHYVTIPPLFDFVGKFPSTHSSTVLNSLSSSIEDLSCLVYLCIVCYVYGQRGWIIPSIYCSDEV
uniref:80A08_24 n=1 Tax=Brassica rapa subsp. pekinensis TaxID=51351 RepID=Q4ABP3_BRARP|nr:80A08_24 [Brassica rapa subsp. pekinensis]